MWPRARPPTRNPSGGFRTVPPTPGLRPRPVNLSPRACLRHGLRELSPRACLRHGAPPRTPLLNRRRGLIYAHSPPIAAPARTTCPLRGCRLHGAPSPAAGNPAAGRGPRPHHLASPWVSSRRGTASRPSPTHPPPPGASAPRSAATASGIYRHPGSPPSTVRRHRLGYLPPPRLPTHCGPPPPPRVSAASPAPHPLRPAAPPPWAICRLGRQGGQGGTPVQRVKAVGVGPGTARRDPGAAHHRRRRRPRHGSSGPRCRAPSASTPVPLPAPPNRQRAAPPPSPPGEHGVTAGALSAHPYVTMRSPCDRA